MIMPAKITYDTTLFAGLPRDRGSWLRPVACGSAFNLRGQLARFAAAIVMGIAVCGHATHRDVCRAGWSTRRNPSRQPPPYPPFRLTWLTRCLQSQRYSLPFC